MSYILKQFDTDLLRFDMQKDVDGVSAQILSVNGASKSLLPLDLEISDQGLAKWLKHGRFWGIVRMYRTFLQNSV